MKSSADRAVAIVGVGAVLPGAPNAPKFWQNIKEGVYSITEVSPARWDPALYYDADPKVPDKTYSKIGGWVRDWEWDPLKWRMPIPPRVGQAMDLTQKWAIVTVREALTDYGYPNRPLDAERTAVILGNAMAGDTHLYSAARVLFSEYSRMLGLTPGFLALPDPARQAILKDLHARMGQFLPEITEDTMPGELANIIAGRIAALWDFKGPNFVADAACASTMAALSAAIGGLVENNYDAVLTGGIDANMSPSTFVKFCKIGALSPTGSRPYAAGADGFIMGEGAVTFLMKRLADAERAGDRIYAVIRGLGGSSDGRGKGITAPNPIGQKLAVRRAWQNAGVIPSAGDLMEGHGTSTVVGDVVEVQSLSEVFSEFGLPWGSVALGSVKSNIGHLKGAAGAAGILKAMYALHEKVLPPSANFRKPNPDIDFAHSPFYVNDTLKPWAAGKEGVRRASVSAFGFGGTNFHVVLEEYMPGRIAGEGKLRSSVPVADYRPEPAEPKNPLRGAMLIGAESEPAIIARLRAVLGDAVAGIAPAVAPPAESDLRAPLRLAIDYADAAELADKCGKALKAFEENQPGRWKALRAKGIFLGKGPAPKVAFLFAGQGSQYVNMLQHLRQSESIVAETFDTADEVMLPMIHRKLSDCIYLNEADEQALARAEQDLKQTAITQPAVLTTEVALSRLLGAYGIFPDMVMGHSLGEYGALVASGVLSFEEALRAVSARGTEMTKCAFDDNGIMAAVLGPIDEVDKILATIDGYVVIANINSTKEAVIGGSTPAVEKAMEALRAAGYRTQQLQVSHAFHTKIVAPASESLAGVLGGMNLQPPTTPIIANVTGTFYPMGPGVVPDIIDLLGRQVASSVQFVKGLHTLYEAGARIFVEVGPKRVLYGFVEDVLGDREGVVSLFTNHPRIGEAASVNLALCGLYAAGLGVGVAGAAAPAQPIASAPAPASGHGAVAAPASRPAAAIPVAVPPATPGPAPVQSQDRYVQLGYMFVEFLERGFQIYSGGSPAGKPARIMITGASLGLPGVARIFDDANIARILRGGQFIGQVPMHLRRAMVEKNITRLVKTESGEGRFETIQSLDDVIKLAARASDLDLVRDFGFPEDRLAALDHVTRLAIAAGIDALRDAGIPLVMRYKTTTKGTMLPDRWGLPESMRDDTGVLFTSAFPGYDSYEEIISGFYRDRIRHERLNELLGLRSRAMELGGAGNGVIKEMDLRIAELRAEIDKNPYHFDRRFLFRVLSMGHSQFAEYIGARGPNTSTNAACASGTQAVAMASDWIQTGRCKRVIVLSADDITSENLMGWFGSGFLASGAAATDDVVENAATPFDRRRHGLIIGMGASAMVVESHESAQQRGLQPICEVLGSVAANSAFHGTRLDVSHICQIMEKLISDAEARWGLNRYEIAPQTVFVSHETYTPARGGSASAEVFALRHVFKEAAAQIVVANTKGATGHPMAVGVEDVVGVKILETGIVPPVPNFKEVDPELGMLNLSKGGAYPIQYALRLGAGFGSQICMTLSRWIPTPDGRRRSPEELGYSYRITDPAAWRTWMKQISGAEQPELEVVLRTLRVKDQAKAAYAANGQAQGKVAAAATAEPKQAPAVSAPIPPAAAAAPAPVAPSEPARAVTAADPVQVEVMRIIAEKTGYPTDMLDLDLDLEADLGIDTVKQAEMFAAIRAAYDIPREDALKLRDFPTLAHAVKFVYDRRPDMKAPVSAVPAPAAVPVPAVPVALPTAAPASDGVREKVMAIIAEKTGYPLDMLDPDLDLEADLGIDTVKQAEMFAAIRAAYDIPREDSLKLRDFPTLAHAFQFVYDRRPDLKSVDAAPLPPLPAAPAVPAPVAAELATAAPPAEAADDEVKATVLRIIAEKTGYPPDMLDLDLDLEADLGIDTVKQAEMFAAIRAAYDIPRDDAMKLRDFPTLKHTIQFVYDRRPDLTPVAVAVPVAAPPALAATAVPAPSVAVAPPPEAADDEVKAMVLRIIAEKTGYPPDMLDLDLDLEADLGIDTVKQAEMFAAIRSAYDIPRDDALKLRDFPTLKHTIQFVYDRRPDLKPGSPPASLEAHEPAPAPSAEHVAASAALAGSMEAAAALPRRVPAPRLRPSLALCKPTGVALNADSRILLMSDQRGVGKALAGKLEKMGVEVLLVKDAPDADELTRRIEAWSAERPIQGIFWLPALDLEGDIAGMDLAVWRESTRVRVKLLYAAVRALYTQLGPQGTFLVSATRLGGMHGYDEAGAVAPLGGSVSGFTKAFKREKGEMLVKAVDFEPSKKATALAEALIEESLWDPGAVEIGHKGIHRWTIGLAEQPLTEAVPELALGRDTVFVVTGAAGSIVSAITADLAAASGGTFHLLDLTPTPDPAHPDLQKLTEDKEGLKRDIFERLKAGGERATPALVEKEMAALERSHAAMVAIESVRKAGGKAHYYSVNLLDSAAVAAVMSRVAEVSGRVDVLLHAAGLEISHLLPDKKPGEFDLVFDVKSDGWFNIMSNLGAMPLGSAVVFSSIAGRFGNGGQTDYSSANDLLCKLVSNFRSSRPGSRGIAIDWTAWGGIGMAARGSIPTVMKQAGIDMLAPEAGIPMIRRELTHGGKGEVIVAQKLGIMLREFDETGGLNTAIFGGAGGANLMTARVAGMGLYSGLIIETTLDPSRQPFLFDHQISGTPVLPGVMGIEALAEAASILYPDWHVGAIEQVQFHAPFKFYRSQPRTVTLGVDFAVEGNEIVACSRLLGSRTLHGQAEPETTTHFTAHVRLVKNAPKAEKCPSAVEPEDVAKVVAGDIYRLYFHGPAYQVVEKSWRAGNEIVGLFASNLPANHDPGGLPTLMAPRLIELCFQTAGLWELATQARMGLPYLVDRVRVYRPSEGGQTLLHSIVTPRADGAFDARVVDQKGNVWLALSGYRTMALPDPVDDQLLLPLRAAIG